MKRIRDIGIGLACLILIALLAACSGSPPNLSSGDGTTLASQPSTTATTSPSATAYPTTSPTATTIPTTGGTVIVVILNDGSSQQALTVNGIAPGPDFSSGINQNYTFYGWSHYSPHSVDAVYDKTVQAWTVRAKNTWSYGLSGLAFGQIVEVLPGHFTGSIINEQFLANGMVLVQFGLNDPAKPNSIVGNSFRVFTTTTWPNL